MQCFKPKNLVRIRIRIRIRGNDGKPRIVYLGPCGSEQARQRHEQLIAEYLTWQDQPETASVTINRLCVALREHAHWYYFKDGEVAAEVSAIRCSLRPLIELYGRQIVADFGPKKLILLREQMIEPA